MNGRRTSAEIINATLLEVFLAFIFVVLSIAWFERTRASKAEAAQAKAESERNEARFNSPFPPPCRLGFQQRDTLVPTEDFLTATLAVPGRLDVLMTTDQLGYKRGV